MFVAQPSLNQSLNMVAKALNSFNVPGNILCLYKRDRTPTESLSRPTDGYIWVIFSCAATLYPTWFFLSFFFFLLFFLSVHGPWYAGLWKLWGAVGGWGEPRRPGSPQIKSKLKIHTKPKTQSYNLNLTKPNQNWTAKPNQTVMAPQTKSKLTIPSKPNQTVFNQTQSKEIYQSKLNQSKPKQTKSNQNHTNKTKSTKPNHTKTN